MRFYEPGNKRFFTYYNSVEDLRAQFEAIKQQVVSEQRALDDDFLANSQGFPSTYRKIDELDQLVRSFDVFRTTIDSGGSFKKTRIKISDDPRYVFSFSLASKGLFRIPEYFSQEIADKYPFMFNQSGPAASDHTMVPGVVDPNKVEKIELANTVFYSIKIDGMDFPLRQQQKGTAYILQNNPRATLSYANSNMPYAEPQQYQGVSLAYASNFRKSYLEMPKEGGKGRAVDIYIPFDLVSYDLDVRMTSAIPLILASEYFVQSKIKVRINILRAIGKPTYKNGDISQMCVFTVKDFDETLDWNKVAVLRGIFDVGWDLSLMNASIIAVQNKELVNGVYKNRNLTAANTGKIGFLTYNSDTYLFEEFGRYRNWLYEQAEKGTYTRKLVPKPLMLTLSTRALLESQFTKSTADPGNTTGNEIKSKFNLLLDMVDLYYNDKTNSVLSRINERLKEEQKNTTEIKQYFIQLAGMLYRDNYPSQGTYATAQEELDKLDQEYNQLIGKITQFTGG